MCDCEALLKVLSSSQLCSSPITDPTKALVWGQTRDTPVEQELALPWVSFTCSSQKQLHTIWHCVLLGTVHSSWCHLGRPSLHWARKIQLSYFPALLELIPRVAEFPHKANSIFSLNPASPCKWYSWEQQCLSDEHCSEKKRIIAYKPFHVLPQAGVSLRIHRCINHPKYKSNLHQKEMYFWQLKADKRIHYL